LPVLYGQDLERASSIKPVNVAPDNKPLSIEDIVRGAQLKHVARDLFTKVKTAGKELAAANGVLTPELQKKSEEIEELLNVIYKTSYADSREIQTIKNYYIRKFKGLTPGLQKIKAEKGKKTQVRFLDNFAPPAHIARVTPYPLPAKAGALYRVMALNEKDFLEINKKGLLRVRTQESTYQMGYEWGGVKDVILSASEGVSAIWAATSPVISYGIDANKIPAVVRIRQDKNWTSSYRDARNLYTYHDIPPRDIEEISVLLDVEGGPRWGSLVFEHGAFFFTPY
jgi:hypothetical protein